MTTLEPHTFPDGWRAPQEASGCLCKWQHVYTTPAHECVLSEGEAVPCGYCTYTIDAACAHCPGAHVGVSTQRKPARAKGHISVSTKREINYTIEICSREEKIRTTKLILDVLWPVLVHFFLLISYSCFIKLHYKTDVCKTKLELLCM
jgi:hypothetical protein